MFRVIRKRRKNTTGEDGYLLLAVIFAVTVLIIGLAMVAPAIKTQIQRDREDELIHRAHQYTRAIQLYYRKFGRYPNSVDDLLSTNNLRFLRKKYTDPITGKDEWRIIHFGEAAPKPVPAYLQGRVNGASPAGGGAFGNPTPSAAGAFGSGPGGANPATGTGTTFGTTSGVGAGAVNAVDISQRLPGTAIGGGPMVGIASTSNKTGLKEIDGKTKYSEWEFTYDPTLDMSRGVGGVGVPNGGIPNAPGLNPGQNNNPTPDMGPRPQRPNR